MEILRFPGGSDGKESACNAGDSGLVPGLGRSPGEGNHYPSQCSCLENSMDRRAWKATAHGAAQSDTYTHIANICFVDLGSFLLLIPKLFVS